MSTGSSWVRLTGWCVGLMLLLNTAVAMLYLMASLVPATRHSVVGTCDIGRGVAATAAPTSDGVAGLFRSC